MNNRDIINRLLVATPTELVELLDHINLDTFTKNKWRFIAVKASYASLIATIDDELSNCNTYLSFGNFMMDYVDCQTGESFSYDLKQAISNLILAREFLQNPPILEKSDGVVEQLLVCQTEGVVNANETSTTDQNLIKGVNGLAKFLGCGTTYAQAVINSKVLMRDGIQYKCGGWLFNKSKLEKLLKENPELLKDVHIKRGRR